MCMGTRVGYCAATGQRSNFLIDVDVSVFVAAVVMVAGASSVRRKHVAVAVSADWRPGRRSCVPICDVARR